MFLSSPPVFFWFWRFFCFCSFQFLWASRHFMEEFGKQGLLVTQLSSFQWKGCARLLPTSIHSKNAYNWLDQIKCRKSARKGHHNPDTDRNTVKLLIMGAKFRESWVQGGKESNSSILDFVEIVVTHVVSSFHSTEILRWRNPECCWSILMLWPSLVLQAIRRFLLGHSMFWGKTSPEVRSAIQVLEVWSWESKGSLPMPHTPLKNKASLRDY